MMEFKDRTEAEVSLPLLGLLSLVLPQIWAGRDAENLSKFAKETGIYKVKRDLSSIITTLQKSLLTLPFLCFCFCFCFFF